VAPPLRERERGETQVRKKRLSNTAGVTADDLHFTVDGRGPPVVLIHGFGESTFSWRYLIPALTPRHRVYAIDLKGFGHSPKPLDSGYSVRDQAKLILEFLELKSITAPTLIGHSFGGGIALLASLELQSRGVRPAGIVLIDTIALPQHFPLFISLLRIPLLAEIATFLIPARTQARYGLRLAYFDDSKIPLSAENAYAESLRQPGGRHAIIATARRIVPADLPELVSQYPKINVPTLVLWGREDEITPIDVGERLHRAIPQSVFRVIEASGHVPHEENYAEATAMIVAFVDAR
jgi:pimeloyl-ACP methyl ester carboxylesterase